MTQRDKPGGDKGGFYLLKLNPVRIQLHLLMVLPLFSLTAHLSLPHLVLAPGPLQTLQSAGT